jgi:hypothetical protein
MLQTWSDQDCKYGSDKAMEKWTMKHRHPLESPEEIQKKKTNHAQRTVQEHSEQCQGLKEVKTVKKHLLVYLVVPE